jgi:hypothetical protein
LLEYAVITFPAKGNCEMGASEDRKKAEDEERASTMQRGPGTLYTIGGKHGTYGT